MSDSKHPIATQTIARIYVQQGKLDQAIAVYEHLLEAHPHDEALIRELAVVRGKVDAQGDLPLPDLDALMVDRTDDIPPKIRCRWRISEDGGGRARLVLGADGQLTLRLSGFPENAAGKPDDIAIDTHDGTLIIAPPAGAILLTAAIGLLDDDGNFASVAHCDLVQL